MKLVKQASGKKTIKMSRKEWTDLGKKAGWISKKAQSAYDRWLEPDDDEEAPDCPECGGEMNRGSYCGRFRGVEIYNWDCADENCDGEINNER